MKLYLTKRIAELNKIDTDACTKRFDNNLPKFEREYWREYSNEVTFARQELERALKHLEKIEPKAIQSNENSI